ncbi:MAG: stage II sporulation protein M [Crocinitomicaceae bacterium]|nr:stage II sporulation protein M [Crocinitomicaceae bacterium]
MKETAFIQQNKKKWARFEKLSGNKNNDPDEVSELFTEITEDLSYARTFYPRRSVRVYLNQLAQGVFTSLYKQRKQPIGNFAKYWTETVPLEMYRARYILLTSFLFFLLAAGIGILSQHFDADFVRVILGDDYVESTERRIAAGNPMGVYGTMDEGSMFWQITVNNIRVAFMVFAAGITFTILSYFLLLYNGVMLGSFQWWFKSKGLLLTSFLAVWIHGAFEISSIVIAGAAGITVGNGLIFPKSYTRLQSLVFSAKRGLVIMLSLIPFFIIAGFLESYVTRHYQSIPDVVKALIILVSFTIMILYYVIYPQFVAKRHPEKIELKEIPRYIQKRPIEWFKIRNVGETFTDTFYIFVQKISHLSRIFFGVIFPLALILCAVIYLLEYRRFDYTDMAWYENMGTLFGTGSDFEFYKLFGWPLLLALLLGAVYFVTQDDSEENLISNYFKFIIKPFIWLYVLA